MDPSQPEADRPLTDFAEPRNPTPDAGYEKTLDGPREMQDASCEKRVRVRPLIPIKTRRDYNFFSSFLTSALTFSQKDSFGAFLHPSMRTGIIFSIPAT